MMKDKGEYFTYRTILGCWINDISSVPRRGHWPARELDESLEQDFVAYLDLMKELDFTSIILFGLFVTRNWEVDYRKSVSPERKEKVKRIMGEAHKRGIKMLYGLGLYSWGFDKIIRELPEVRGPNPHSMCASKEASYKKMAELIDFLLSEFSFDGFHFESGDQGRCKCKSCRERPDLIYHIELNERMAKYVRSRWPEKIIEVYTPGVNKSKEDWLAWADASRYFSFIIDADISQGQQDVADQFGPASRREIISSLQCAYGTRSATWIYPPQRWERLRWFLPIIDRRAVHYRGLAGDGARAVMVSGGPIINPGEEATLRASGKLLQNPFKDVHSVILETVEEMFEPKTKRAAEELADIFWHAEKAYFANANVPEGAEILLDPLCGEVAGPPIYLQTRMYAHTLGEYETAIKDIQKRFLKMKASLSNSKKADRLEKCLTSVLADIETIKKDNSMLQFPANAIDEKTWGTEWIFGED